MSTVGIDLGASCKTGVWQRGRADVVANELVRGQRRGRGTRLRC